MAGNTAKHSVRNLTDKKRFFVDDAIIDDHYVARLGVSTFAVYCVLSRYSNKEQSCYPKLETISQRLGLSKRTVIRSLEMLEALKIVHIERTNGKQSVYHLLDSKKWAKVKPPTNTSSSGVTGDKRTTGDILATGDKRDTALDAKLSTTGISGVTGDKRDTGDISDTPPVAVVSPLPVTNGIPPYKKVCILRFVKKNGKYLDKKKHRFLKKLRNQKQKIALVLRGREENLYQDPQIIQDLAVLGFEPVRIMAALETARGKLKPVSYFITILADARYALSDAAMNRAKGQMHTRAADSVKSLIAGVAGKLSIAKTARTR